jgi:hypothetical protein
MSAALSMTLTHDGVDYRAEIATVESTFLGEEDHGIWTAMLRFAGPSWGQGNDAMTLDTYDKETKRRIGTAFGMDHIMRIAEALGCRNWEAVKGKRCLVLRRSPYGRINGIADLDAQRVLIFQVHADDWLARDAAGASS